MDESLEFIFKLNLFQLILLVITISYSFYLLKNSKGKAGMTPESPQVGVSILTASIVSMVAVAIDTRYTLQFGLSKIRTARILYKATGEKSDLSVPGYTSLNTLMLAVLMHILGFLIYGASMYYCFIGFDTSDKGLDSFEL